MKPLHKKQDNIEVIGDAGSAGIPEPSNRIVLSFFHPYRMQITAGMVAAFVGLGCSQCIF